MLDSHGACNCVMAGRHAGRRMRSEVPPQQGLGSCAAELDAAAPDVLEGNVCDAQVLRRVWQVIKLHSRVVRGHR
jgi:hypothetical protein